MLVGRGVDVGLGVGMGVEVTVAVGSVTSRGSAVTQAIVVNSRVAADIANTKTQRFRR